MRWIQYLTLVEMLAETREDFRITTAIIWQAGLQDVEPYGYCSIDHKHFLRKIVHPNLAKPFNQLTPLTVRTIHVLHCGSVSYNSLQHSSLIPSVLARHHRNHIMIIPKFILSFANTLANPCIDATCTADRNAYTRSVHKCCTVIITLCVELTA